MSRPSVSHGIAGLITHGVIWSSIGKTASVALTFALNAKVVRILGVADAGIYFTATTALVLGTLVGTLGTQARIVRLFARASALGVGSVHLAAHFLRIGRAPIAVAGIAFTAGVIMLSIGRGSAIDVFRFSALGLIALWTAFSVVTRLFVEALRGLSKMAHVAWLDPQRGLLVRGGTLGTILVAAPFAHLELESVLAIGVVVSAVNAIACMILGTEVLRSFRTAGLTIGRILPPSRDGIDWRVLAYNLSVYLVANVGLWVLAIAGRQSEVALLATSMQMALLLKMPFDISSQFFPSLIAGASNSDLRSGQLSRLLRLAALVTSAVAALGTAIFAIIGRDILRIVFGEPFQDAFPVLVTLATGTTIALLFGLGQEVLLMRDRERELMGALLLALALSLLATIVLVPFLGAIGAAMGWAIGVVAQFSFSAFGAAKALGIRTCPWDRPTPQGTSR